MEDLIKECLLETNLGFDLEEAEYVAQLLVEKLTEKGVQLTTKP